MPTPMPTPWNNRAIAEALAAGLRVESDRLDAEQAVRGIDALDEREIHALLRDGLAGAGLGVLAEQRFPAGAARKRRSEGERCDLVVMRSPGDRLADPLLSDTLFAGDGIDPAEALWIEVKIAAQHALIDGVARPNPRYSQQLLTGVTGDVRKLSRESGIRHGAACAVVFTETAEIADHDLSSCAHRCLDRGLPIGAPTTTALPITERIGNAWCVVALLPVCL
jgi:hypothetical protein